MATLINFDFREVDFRVLLTQLILIPFIGGNVAAVEKVCVREDNGNVACGELVPSSPKAESIEEKSSKSFVDSANGLIFYLNACYKSKKGLDCSIDVTNNTDFEQTISGIKASVRDDEGHFYQSVSAVIGGGSWWHRMPPKSRTEASIRFLPNGPLNNGIQVLSVKYGVNYRSEGSFELRDFITR